MKTLEFFKKAFFALFVTSLTLGFVACSDSKEDGTEPEPDPETTIIKKVPLEINIKRNSIEDGDLIYKYEYNDDNQLVKLTKINTIYTRPEIYTLVYSDKGEINKIITTEDGDDSIATFSYDEKTGLVTISEGSDSFSFKVDKNGYPVSEKDEESGDSSTIVYDSDYNLTEVKHTEIRTGSDYTSIYEAEYINSFSSVYSPFQNINLPTWVLGGAEGTLPEIIESDEGGMILGKHLPSAGKYTSTNTTKRPGKEDSVYTETMAYTYHVEKSEDNYPTEFSITMIFAENGKEEKPQVNSYSIQYKDIK